jgi:hypothetical protein
VLVVGADGLFVTGGEGISVWDRILASSDFETWQERLCRTVRHNLTEAVWRRLIPATPYRKTCPQYP